MKLLNENLVERGSHHREWLKNHKMPHINGGRPSVHSTSISFQSSIKQSKSGRLFPSGPQRRAGKSVGKKRNIEMRAERFLNKKNNTGKLGSASV